MAVTTELSIARHGEAECNVSGVVGGDRGCTGLTARGREQARRLASRLAREHGNRAYDALLVSPQRRAGETAAEIAARTGLPATVVPGLRGPDYGAGIDGAAWRPIRAAFGGNPRRHPDRAIAAGAETWSHFLRRAAAALREVLSRYAGQRIIVVSHREVVDAAHAFLLELPPGASARLSFAADHASLTRWQRRRDEFGHETWRLAAYNDVCHLPAPGDLGIGATG